ncbi:hypothetical protein M011DRAFT_460661 [Sporormia fimetaria CBS 119925]|uniref:Uncharacterized protein n=1 Tax=Sporormia fimetaria CBS 119925 TaxID=1340428 RepID=A0A6A6V5N3_9PLEO|nr:hypothetical protein M011DRAFT_460661 [Sporormia fimetaria CBS 119925]
MAGGDYPEPSEPEVEEHPEDEERPAYKKHPEYEEHLEEEERPEDEERPELMSDGKRMRTVWQPSDGDGDSSSAVLERSLSLVRGHPTWKLFMDEISLPIVRGTDEEPPHYVYLDDRACYAIYCSNAYTHEEMRKFWPFDYNHQGHIKQGRPNRGNPAYLDDSRLEFVQGKLRAKGKWYTFSGAPEVTEYRPTRPTSTYCASEASVTPSKNYPGSRKPAVIHGSKASRTEAASKHVAADAEMASPRAHTAVGLQPKRLPPRPLPKVLDGETGHTHRRTYVQLEEPSEDPEPAPMDRPHGVGKRRMSVLGDAPAKKPRKEIDSEE